MNEKDKLINRNNNARLVKASNRDRGVLKWSVNETWNHVVIKFRICYALKKAGKEFCCEAIFAESGLRADVLNLDDGIAYEVVNTEEEASIEKKKKDYPVTVIAISANKTFNEKEIYQ